MATVALIGCAHIHTPAFLKKMKERTDIQVRYVWDHDKERAVKNAEELGSKAITGLGRVWKDEQVDAVVICSETNRHLKLVMAAAKARKPMFVEKPLGFGAKDSNKMAAAIEASNLLFQTGYFMRSQGMIQTIKKLVDDGSFGRITRVRASNCHAGALKGWFDTQWRWMADVKQSGVGGFGDLGTHILDLLLWIFGEVEAVTGQIDNGTARYPDCDETGEALLRFKSGVIGTMAAGWTDVANPVSFLVSGTEGHAVIIDGQLYIKSEKLNLDGKTPYAPVESGWPHAFDLFLDAINHRQSGGLVGAREAAYRSTVMEAIYTGAKKRKWVAV